MKNKKIQKKPIKIAIAGLGVVGGSVCKILHDNQTLISNRLGGDIIEIVAISARNRNKAKDLGCFDNFDDIYYDSPLAMAQQADYDILLELIGGTDGIAPQLWHTAIARKKHLITANKALLAERGPEFLALAHKNRVTIKYESAVAGGLPVIKLLKEGLAATQVKKIQAILNGTCNYILTRMDNERSPMPAILSDAQAKGYAEADPTLDIGGFDAGHKLAILCNLAFGGLVDYHKIFIIGIEKISPLDFEFAEKFGFKIKLIAGCELTENGIKASVEPILLPADCALANTNDVYNGVLLFDDLDGRVFLRGRGAGAGPTGVAVVADIMDCARHIDRNIYNVAHKQCKILKIVPRQLDNSCWYIRLEVLDKPGVLAQIAKIFQKHHISIEKLLQNSRAEGQPVHIIFITHHAQYGQLERACRDIEKLPLLVSAPCIIKVS